MYILTEQDFVEASKELNVELATIKAVDKIESRGKGFEQVNTDLQCYFLPVILYERHIFSRLTGGKYDEEYPSISNKTRGGYGNGSAKNQHERLNKAAELDSKNALQSASWGRFQIMGFNYKLAGFNALNDFIEAMKKDEKEQLNAFVKFLKNTKLDIHLRNKNWAAFAKGYNGKNYAINSYDVKLKQAYENFL